MNRTIPWLILGLFAGCATPVNVAATHDQSAEFAGLRTYAWLPPADSGDPRINEDRIMKMVPPVVDAQMAGKGYRKIEEGRPDFQLRYYVLLSVARTMTTAMRDFGQQSDQIWTSDYAPRIQDYREAYEPYGREYEIGELVIEVHDPGTKEPIWRGFAWTELEEGDSESKTRNTIERAVTKLLKQFPPD
jgi:hypothetical protein